jgi:MFS family permease
LENSPNNTLRLIVIGIVCCLLTGIAYGFGMYLFPMVMPEMLAELNLSYTDAGIVTGFGQAAPLLILPFISRLTQRIGALRLIVSSQIIGATLLLSLSFIQGYYSLMLLIFLLRGWPMLVWIPLISVVTNHFDLSWRATVLTTASATACFFVFINGLLSSFFLEYFDWRTLWQVVASICLITGIGCWLSLKVVNAWHEQGDNQGKKKGSVSTILRWCKTRSGINLLLLFGVTGFSFVPFQMYLAPYLRDNMGLGLETSALIWSVMGISGMIGGMVMGRVTDRFGVKTSYLLVFTMATISAIMVSLPISSAQLITMAILFGVAQATIFGLGPAYIAKVLPPESAAMALSSATTVMVLASLMGNFLGGWSGGQFNSFWFLYVFLGVLFLLGALVSCGLKSEKSTHS